MFRDLLDVTRAFTRVQSKLVRELLAAQALHDHEYFRDLRDGTIALDGEQWTFHRHGAGVTFRSDRGAVVNAHVALVEVPDGVDAWRLLLYLESLGIHEVVFEG